jgi:hypothetical protein
MPTHDSLLEQIWAAGSISMGKYIMGDLGREKSSKPDTNEKYTGRRIDVTELGA